MVVFGRNLLFLDEPQLDNDTKDSLLEDIPVLEGLSLSASFDSALKTGWFPMSGQTARYYSSVPFHEADRAFSWALEIKDVLTMFWDAKKRQIRYSKGREYDPERLRFWVLHTFFPLVLELERTYHILHVGSVEIDGCPVAFSALSYGGKSTLTDLFLKKGHLLLSDDSLGIDKREEGYFAVPSYPFHRPYRQLETLGYHTKHFLRASRPLFALFALEKADPDADVAIVELKGIEKFKAFHYSSFIDFDFMKKECFDFFTQMAKEIPIYRIEIPWDLERLPEVYDAICKTVALKHKISH